MGLLTVECLGCIPAETRTSGGRQGGPGPGSELFAIPLPLRPRALP
jgi:hypothetical protein